MKKTILDAADECGLARFLSHRGPQACVLAPKPVLEALAASADKPLACVCATTVEEVPAQVQRIFAYDPEDEPALLARLRALHPRKELYGWLQHVIPALVAGQRLPPDSRRPAPPQTRFAVVCTPRTGSTFLCELMAAGGLGAPKEHLRRPMVQVMRAPQVDTAAVLDYLECRAARNGIFGSKLISHFLFDAVGEENAGATLSCLVARDYRLIRLRRDAIEQALSRYMSKRSGVWHARGEVSAQSQRRLSRVEYSFDEILTGYQRAVQESEGLDRAMAGLPPDRILTLHYADFTAEPLQALKACADFLGVAADPSAIDFKALPTKLSESVAQPGRLRERFTEDLAAFQAGRPLPSDL